MDNYNIDDFDSAKAQPINGNNDNKQEERQPAQPINGNNDNKQEERQPDKDKDRDRRERSRSRERKPKDKRDRSRSRERKRDRSRDRRRSRSRDRKRDRSRDRRRSRSRDRRRSRSRDKDRERRSRSRDRRRSRSRDRRRSRSKSSSVDPREVGKSEAEIKMQREIDSLTKDQRTVFVGQLVAKVNERMLKDYFGEMGKVASVLLLRDRHTGRHKGCGYVEMRDLADIPNILLLNNSVPNFQKYPILVKPSEAEKNFAARKPDSDSNNANSGKIGLKEGWDISRGDPRIYIGSIHPSISEEQLKSLLSSFGVVEEIKLHKDELGKSKGFGFARYADIESAQVAITGSKGIELFGKALKIGPVNDGNQSVQVVSSAAATLGVKSVDEAAVAAALAAVTASAQSNSFGSMGSSSNNWKLDLDDSGRSGMKLDANSRLALMAKLGQGAGIQVPTINSTSSIAGQPSTCFMLKNMFDPAEETDPNWDVEIKEDVMEESGKFGNIEHCHVEKRKPGGLVFLKFTTIASAVQAANNLNNRFFGKRQVTATFLDPQQYQTMAK